MISDILRISLLGFGPSSEGLLFLSGGLFRPPDRVPNMYQVKLNLTVQFNGNDQFSVTYRQRGGAVLPNPTSRPSVFIGILARFQVVYQILYHCS